MLNDYLDNLYNKKPTEQLNKIIPFFDYGNINNSVVEIHGRHSSGKTTLIYEYIREYQNELDIHLINTDYKLDIEYLTHRVGKQSEFFISQTNDLQQLTQSVLTSLDLFDVIIIDSLGVFDYTQALRLLSTIHPRLVKSNSALILTNQMRADIRRRRLKPFADDYLNELTVLRFNCRHKTLVKKDWVIEGKIVSAQVIKNLLSTNYKSKEMRIV